MAGKKNNTWPLGMFILLVLNLYFIGDFVQSYYNFHYRSDEILAQNKAALDQIGASPEAQRQAFNAVFSLNESINLAVLAVLAIINCIFFSRYLFKTKVHGVFRVVGFSVLTYSVIYLLYCAGFWMMKLL
jgi:hypothetical protein